MSVKPAELAHRIETGIETKSGRYDWASKVEVLAFVKKKVAESEGGLRGEMDRRETALATLETRVAQLERPWWKRLLRRS